MKTTRLWLTKPEDSDSSITVTVSKDNLDLKLRDCSRSIEWVFSCYSKSRLKHSLAKIRKIKAVIDEIEKHLADRALKASSEKDD